jgi:hypothetical protein
VRRALLIAATTAALGACSTSTLDPGPEPPPSVVTFELRNDSLATVYLFQECFLDYTITSLADPPYQIGRQWACGCDCALSSCPVCGACFQGSREVPGGAAVSESWTAVNVTAEPRPAGACEKKHTLPAGPYRIDIPVYTSDADATARTAARIATQSFVLPAPDDHVTVALGVSP